MDEDLIVLGAPAETPAAGDETSVATEAPDSNLPEGAEAAQPGTEQADPAVDASKPEAPKGAGPGGAVGGGMMGLKKAGTNAWGDRKKLVQSAAVARLLTDPRSLPDLKNLAKLPPKSRAAERVMQRLLLLANGSAAPAREGQTSAAAR